MGDAVWAIQHVASTGSTNADVSAAARAGAAEGLVVVADHQQAGRGRLDRSWDTPAGQAVALSFLLRPTGVPLARWPWLPLLVGVAVVEALEGAAGVRAVLKWPNDVLVSGRKLAGILVERVENEADGDAGPAAVVGVGINLAQDADALAPGATSVQLAAGRTVPRDVVVAELAERFGRRYADWRAAQGDPAAFLAAGYRRHCDTLGRHVRAELPDGSEISGQAVDIDEAGRLVLDTGGATTAIGAADIVHLRPGQDAQHQSRPVPGC